MLALVATGCVPLHGRPSDFTGRWKVDWACGVERLELRADSTYAQSIRFPDGSSDRNEGRWYVEGGDVVLRGGRAWCGPSGDRMRARDRDEVRLSTQWEWGRVVLEFNPDWQGFTRER